MKRMLLMHLALLPVCLVLSFLAGWAVCAGLGYPYW